MGKHDAGMLRKNALGMLGIVFLVIATNGPLTALVGLVPAGIALGNGVGVPGSFLIVGVIYLIFSVGFVAMGRYIKSSGAFYVYVSNGLGRPAGIATAFLVLISYNAMLIGAYAVFGFFVSQALGESSGFGVPWWIISLATILVVQYFGTRNVEFNGRMLGALMLAEMAVIAIFDLGVVAHGGGATGFDTASFVPANVFVSGLGPTLVFVVNSFMGFETTAIYAEEARNAERTIPLATYVAVLIILVFFALSSWLLIVSYGSRDIVEAATKDPGNLWFVMASRTVGKWLADAMSVLLITSLFAVVLSFHNAISRYYFSLGREGVLWGWLARVHPVQQTPYLASVVQTVYGCAFVLLCAYLKLDVMSVVLPLTTAPAAIGIVAVQCLTCLAVIGFFSSQPRHTNIWQRLIAPILSFAALSWVLYVIVRNMALLTGGETTANHLIPLGMLAVALSGLLFAFWIRRQRPSLYKNFARVLTEG
jgi:amino acid transporter